VGRVVWGFLPLLPAAVHHCAAARLDFAALAPRGSGPASRFQLHVDELHAKASFGKMGFLLPG
jgi:hypothetical protein